MPAGDLLRRLDSRLLPVLTRGAVRLSQPAHRSRLLGTTAALCCAAVLGAAIWAGDRPTGGDLTVGEVVRVGVVTGDSIPAYVQASRAELASLAQATPSTETYALVTLSEYVTPERLAPILRGVAVSEVVGRVPLPDTQTEIVRLPAQRLPADAAAAMAAVAEGKDREARDYHARGAAVSGNGQRERELRQVYESGAAVAQAEAMAFRRGCGCIYAAVVRATPAALDEITGRPGVRSVDPAPEVHRLESAVFLPPLPEQTDVVRSPTDTGLSSGVVTSPGAAVTATGRPAEPSSPAAPASGATVPTPTSTEGIPAGPPGSPASPGASGEPQPSPATPTPAAPASSVPATTPTQSR